MQLKLFVIISSVLFLLDAFVNGGTSRAATDDVESVLKRELSKKYIGTTVEITSSVKWLRGSEPAETSRVAIAHEGMRGDVRFFAYDADNSYSEGVVTFEATTPAWVATRRVYPGEKLAPGMFNVQDVNVAYGAARDYRGVIQSPNVLKEADLISLEARQTILEGQFLASTAVQRVPDIRRGDAVTVLIRSEGLRLSTSGVAQEPGYLNQQIRILTNKTKRELSGKLSSGGYVEVRL